jgi:hypothetical protein
MSFEVFIKKQPNKSLAVADQLLHKNYEFSVFFLLVVVSYDLQLRDRI